MAEHDAAGADPHMRRLSRDACYQDFGRAAREAIRAMMLGDPEPRVAPSFRGLSEGNRFVDGVGRGAALADRRLIDNAQFNLWHAILALLAGAGSGYPRPLILLAEV